MASTDKPTALEALTATMKSLPLGSQLTASFISLTTKLSKAVEQAHRTPKDKAQVEALLKNFTTQTEVLRKEIENPWHPWEKCNHDFPELFKSCPDSVERATKVVLSRDKDAEMDDGMKHALGELKWDLGAAYTGTLEQLRDGVLNFGMFPGWYEPSPLPKPAVAGPQISEPNSLAVAQPRPPPQQPAVVLPQPQVAAPKPPPSPPAANAELARLLAQHAIPNQPSPAVRPQPAMGDLLTRFEPGNSQVFRQQPRQQLRQSPRPPKRRREADSYRPAEERPAQRQRLMGAAQATVKDEPEVANRTSFKNKKAIAEAGEVVTRQAERRAEKRGEDSDEKGGGGGYADLEALDE